MAKRDSLAYPELKLNLKSMSKSQNSPEYALIGSRDNNVTLIQGAKNVSENNFKDNSPFRALINMCKKFFPKRHSNDNQKPVIELVANPVFALQNKTIPNNNLIVDGATGLLTIDTQTTITNIDETQNSATKLRFMLNLKNIKNPTFSLIDFYFKNQKSPKSTDTESDISITENELRVLRLTWIFIKQDIQRVGVIMFMKAFESVPEMKEAFESFRNINSEDLIKSHTLRTHSKKIMVIVELLITSYDVEFDKIKADLVQLGRRHFIYGAKEQFFYIMETQFLRSIMPILIRIVNEEEPLQDIEAEIHFKELKECLKLFGICTTDDAIDFIESVWHKPFAVIKHFMSKGLNEAKDKSN